MFRVERRHPKSILPAEGMLVYSLIRLARPSVLVEIGRLGGASTEWIARALTENCNGIVHSIDIKPPTAEATERLAPWLKNPVILHTCDSHGKAAKKLAAKMGTIDFLLVDGGHGADAVEADCKMWLPRLRGYAVFHDWGQARVREGFEAATKGANLRSINFRCPDRREVTGGLMVLQGGASQ